MKKFVFAFGFLGVLGVLGSIGVGCSSDPCAASVDTYKAKYADCGKEFPVSSTTGSAATCTEAQGKAASCAADCFSAASCDCAGLGDATKCDMADLKTYSDCTAACAK